MKGHVIRNRYEIVSQLGTGGMGEVFLAEDLVLRRKVALKTIREDLAKDEEFQRRIDRECELHARVGSHPNIVTLYDRVDEDRKIYLVMEYVEGKLLYELLEDERGRGDIFAPQTSLSIVRQILEALKAVHGLGIVHRDIKPQNAITRSEGEGKYNIKLMDFGISRESQDAAMTRLALTVAGSPGTPAYMAPELLDSSSFGPVTTATDLYSVGVILYELYAGDAPFSGSITEIYKGHLLETPELLRDHAYFPEKIHRILAKALAKQPKDRYQSAQEFQEDVDYVAGRITRPARERTVHEEPEQTILYNAPPREKSAGKKRKLGRFAFATFLLGALSGSAWYGYKEGIYEKWRDFLPETLEWPFAERSNKERSVESSAGSVRVTGEGRSAHPEQNRVSKEVTPPPGIGAVANKVHSDIVEAEKSTGSSAKVGTGPIVGETEKTGKHEATTGSVVLKKEVSKGQETGSRVGKPKDIREEDRHDRYGAPSDPVGLAGSKGSAIETGRVPVESKAVTGLGGTKPEKMVADPTPDVAGKVLEYQTSGKNDKIIAGEPAEQYKSQLEEKKSVLTKALEDLDKQAPQATPKPASGAPQERSIGDADEELYVTGKELQKNLSKASSIQKVASDEQAQIDTIEKERLAPLRNDPAAWVAEKERSLNKELSSGYVSSKKIIVEQDGAGNRKEQRNSLDLGVGGGTSGVTPPQTGDQTTPRKPVAQGKYKAPSVPDAQTIVPTKYAAWDPDGGSAAYNKQAGSALEALELLRGEVRKEKDGSEKAEKTEIKPKKKKKSRKKKKKQKKKRKTVAKSPKKVEGENQSSLIGNAVYKEKKW